MVKDKFRKMRQSLFYIFILQILVSCNDRTASIGFLNPQPAFGKVHFEIPDFLQGNYRLKDSTKILLGLKPTFDFVNKNTDGRIENLSQLLTINKYSIDNNLVGYFEILKSDLDSSERKNLNKNHIDSLVLELFPKPVYSYHIDSSGISYKIDIKISSNLYTIDKEHVTLKFKNKYYFNTYNEEFDIWKCFQLDYDRKKKILKINSMSENDYEVLRRLIKSENDTVLVTDKMNPSKSSFKKFLGMNGFENSIILEKQ